MPRVSPCALLFRDFQLDLVIGNKNQLNLKPRAETKRKRSLFKIVLIQLLRQAYMAMES